MFADPPGSTNYIYADVPAAQLNDDMMDVAFVKVVGAENYPGGLEALVRAHRVDDGGVNLGDHWKHKYVVDLDGMGYSGRFFSFVESDSAVLKSTVYREFFSDWIQPWYVITSAMRRGIVSLTPIPQAALHPSVAILLRDLQHPRILLRGYGVHSPRRQCHSAVHAR